MAALNFENIWQNYQAKLCTGECTDGYFNLQNWFLRFGSIDSEATKVPDWFRWALNFGASLRSHLIDTRATLVLTTPCDSALTAVVSLGLAVRSIPERNSVHDSSNPFELFLKAAPGTEVKCLPRGSEKNVQSYRLLADRSAERGIAMRKLSGRQKSAVHYMMPNTASWYVFANEQQSFVNSRSLKCHIGMSLLQSLLGKRAESLDWRANQSSIVICTPSQGAASLKHATDAIFISDTISECGNAMHKKADSECLLTLSDLLSISEWQLNSDRECPTYCQLVNSSMVKYENIPQNGQIVFFNGPDAYLRLHNQFQQQSHVVIVSRNSESFKLERLMHLAHAVREVSSPLEISILAPPVGIQLLMLGSRKSKEKKW